MTVQDDDRDEKFTFVVSDPRFEVARGFLRLKPTESVTLEDADKIPLTVTATSTTSGKSIQRGFQLNVYPNPTPWQNHDNPLDVNGDGDITPMDPLMIINVINRLGSFPLNANPPSEGEPGGGGFIDVNGDGEVSPIDVLIVINHLNQRSAVAAQIMVEMETRVAVELETRRPVRVRASRWPTTNCPWSLIKKIECLWPNILAI